MKRIVMALAAVVVVAGAVVTILEEQRTKVVNPIQEKDSIDDLNKVTGLNLATMDGCNEEYFSTIKQENSNPLGQYMFSRKGDFTLRTLKVKNQNDLPDITGFYIENGTLGQVYGYQDEIIPVDEHHYWVGWIKDGVIYSLLGEGCDQTSFEEVYHFYR